MRVPGETIAIEGVCCAGKTTTIKRLASSLGAAVVPELPEFARNLMLPASSGENILRNGFRSIGIEKARMLGATGLSKVASHTILDRSFISALALGYGAIDLIGAANYRKLAGTIAQEVEEGTLQLPDKALYVAVSKDVVTQRNETRQPKLEAYWVDPARIARQIEFYEHLVVEPGIYRVDGEQSSDAVVLACLQTIQGFTDHTSADSVAVGINSFISEV